MGYYFVQSISGRKVVSTMIIYTLVLNKGSQLVALRCVSVGRQKGDIIMKSISANSSEHLKNLLKSINISVRPRGKGRNKHQTETWSEHRLLLSLADTYHMLLLTDLCLNGIVHEKIIKNYMIY